MDRQKDILGNDMTEIVAEIGVNHNGNIRLAKDLIDIAIDAGCDAVKFQAWGENRFPDIEHLRLKPGGLKYLFDYCEEMGIAWWCTPFDDWSVGFLKDCGMTTWKIPSGMVTNFDYLKKIKAAKPKRIIMSTGMCTEDEIYKSLPFLKGGVELLVLQCTTGYPTKLDEINLGVFDVPEHYRGKWFFDGLSDHSGLIEIPVAAVALGAKMIEVHITHDKAQDGPDHKASLEPQELRTMVRMCRNVEKAMGDGEKKPTPRELKVRDKIRATMGCKV